MLRYGIVGLLALHGLIHLMGFAKAFGLAKLEAVTLPVSRSAGVVWLVAALVLCLSAGFLAAGQTRWWMPALGGLILSQTLIAMSWADAKAGTVANVVIGAAIVWTLAGR
jgi:hypothetical protein